MSGSIAADMGGAGGLTEDADATRDGRERTVASQGVTPRATLVPSVGLHLLPALDGLFSQVVIGLSLGKPRIIPGVNWNFSPSAMLLW